VDGPEGGSGAVTIRKDICSERMWGPGVGLRPPGGPGNVAEKSTGPGPLSVNGSARRALGPRRSGPSSRPGKIGAVSFLLRVVVDALALALAAWLLDGISFAAKSDADGIDWQRVLTLVVVAAIFAVVNATVRPILTILSIPFIIVTLGLMILVINALMLMLTGWLSDVFGLGFEVDGFWTAVWGGLIISIATWLLEIVLPDGR
jgi:putative membrane protein